MYRQHFGLRDKPFRVVPSPRFLFQSETHDESRARILYGIRESRGFVVVSGGIGLGKTTVLLSVLDQLESTVRTALVFNPVDTFAQLLRMISFEFGLDAQGDDEVLLMQQLNMFLVERLAEGETCVLLIDEAQNLSIDVLEKVRTLSNLQTEDSSLLQIVLVGQPELMEKLADPRLVQLRQRVGVWHEITPLGIEETRSYIWHRLRLAGAAMPERLIDDRACAAVHRRTEGIPRLVNQLCDTALVIAYGRNDEQVSVQHVEEAADELHLGALGEVTAERPRSVPPRVRKRIPWGVVAATSAILAAVLFWQSPWWAQVRDNSPLNTLLGGIGAGPKPSQAVTGAGSVPDGDSVAAAGHTEIWRGRTPEILAEAERWREEVERWRSRGRTVFSVHLASFRSDENAQRFADELIEKHEDWTAPLYVERSGSRSDWYRVLGGGFRSSTDALAWIEILKSQDGVGYAQLSRLDAGAGPLVPGVDSGMPTGDSR